LHADEPSDAPALESRGGISLRNVSAVAANDIHRVEKITDAGVVRHTGRDDRATTEQVLDPRTRMVLFKLLNKGFMEEINGCISTGKEANVYHAKGVDGNDYAIKIYKTSILVFKDREK
jgi:RIO kinase 1